MLVVSIIGCFTPTIFMGLFGSREIRCKDCPSFLSESDPNSFAPPLTPSEIGIEKLILICKQCRITQPHPTDDPFFHSNTKPLMYFCAAVLVLTYLIGLLFTLRTHRGDIYPSTTSMEFKKGRDRSQVAVKAKPLNKKRKKTSRGSTS